jgi:TIR domain
MADVFISYKAERRRAAEHLKRIVEAHGFSVWYDAGGLLPGPGYRKQIERELRAADAVLVLWCSLSRESDWVEDEARLAKKLGTLVPVRIGPDVDPPLGLGSDQLVDLSRWDGSPGSHLLHPLLTEIERRVGRPSGIARQELERIDRDWRLYGAPRMVTFELVPVEDPTGPVQVVSPPAGALADRSRAAETTLPLDWREAAPARPGGEITVRLDRQQARPESPATLRPAAWRAPPNSAVRVWTTTLRWTLWALAATAIGATQLVVCSGALYR